MESRCWCILVSHERKIKPWRGQVTSQCRIAAEWCLSQAGRLTRMWARVPSACGCGYDAPFSESPYLSPHLHLSPHHFPSSFLLPLCRHISQAHFQGAYVLLAPKGRNLCQRECITVVVDGLPYMRVCLSVWLCVRSTWISLEICVLGSGSLRD